MAQNVVGDPGGWARRRYPGWWSRVIPRVRTGSPTRAQTLFKVVVAHVPDLPRSPVGKNAAQK